MPVDSKEIDCLARVFLAGFRFSSDADTEEVRKRITPELDDLCRTLPDDEATALRTVVHSEIAVRTRASVGPEQLRDKQG